MSGFSHNIDVECPECHPSGRWQQKPLLECTEQDYCCSGVDIANCPECGKAWEISYKVDVLTRCDTAFDSESRQERKAREDRQRVADAAEKERNERIEFERLKEKFQS